MPPRDDDEAEFRALAVQMARLGEFHGYVREQFAALTARLDRLEQREGTHFEAIRTEISALKEDQQRRLGMERVVMGMVGLFGGAVSGWLARRLGEG